MPKLILVRHSEPHIERDKPASSWRLSRPGRARCDLLSAKLRCFSPSVIWCSKEPKALETAEIIANAFGVPTRVADGLEEHHRSGIPFFATKNEFEEAVERFFREPDRLVFGTETSAQALSKFSSAIDRLIEAEPVDFIVVTHGTVMTLYIANVNGVRPMDFWRRLGLPSFAVLALPDKRLQSVSENLIGNGTPG